MNHAPFAIGQTVQARYQIQSVVGRGGMGVVYQAYDPVLQRTVAIKVLPPQLTIDAEFVTRFQREAVASANLRHAHIVTVYDVGQQDGEYFIIMEYLEGSTLEQWLTGHGPMPAAQAGKIIKQIAAALDHAHGRGIVHRDVKPSNIMLDSHDRAVLMDFGLVRAGEGFGPTRSTTVMGTPEYMAPEQVLGQAIDRRTDIYALGVVIFEMLSGKTPFAHTTPLATAHAHAYEAPPPLRSVNKAVSAPVEAVVMKALAKDPAARYQSAGEMAHDLAQAVSGVMPAGLAASSTAAGSRKKQSASPAAGVKTVAMPSPAGGTPPAPPRPSRSKAGALVATGALAMVAVLLAVVLWPRSGAVGDSPTPNPPAIVLAATASDTATQLPRLVSSTDTLAAAQTVAAVEPITSTARVAIATPTVTPIALPTRSPTATSIPADTPMATLTSTPSATPSSTSTMTPSTRPTATHTNTPVPQPDAVVNARNANLRAGPGTNYDRLGGYSQGTALNVVGKNATGDWLKVEVKDGSNSGNIGWVNRDLLRINTALDYVPIAAVLPQSTSVVITSATSVPETTITTPGYRYPAPAFVSPEDWATIRATEQTSFRVQPLALEQDQVYKHEFEAQRQIFSSYSGFEWARKCEFLSTSPDFTKPALVKQFSDLYAWPGCDGLVSFGNDAYTWRVSIVQIREGQVVAQLSPFAERSFIFQP